MNEKLIELAKRVVKAHTEMGVYSTPEYVITSRISQEKVFNGGKSDFQNVRSVIIGNNQRKGIAKISYSLKKISIDFDYNELNDMFRGAIEIPIIRSLGAMEFGEPIIFNGSISHCVAILIGIALSVENQMLTHVLNYFCKGLDRAKINASVEDKMQFIAAMEKGVKANEIKSILSGEISECNDNLQLCCAFNSFKIQLVELDFSNKKAMIKANNISFALHNISQKLLTIFDK